MIHLSCLCDLVSISVARPLISQTLSPWEYFPFSPGLFSPITVCGLIAQQDSLCTLITGSEQLRISGNLLSSVFPWSCTPDKGPPCRCYEGAGIQFLSRIISSNKPVGPVIPPLIEAVPVVPSHSHYVANLQRNLKKCNVNIITYVTRQVNLYIISLITLEVNTLTVCPKTPHNCLPRYFPILSGLCQLWLNIF